MEKPASSKGQRQGGSHRRRLAINITIGMIMVAIAAAGYMFLGPSSGTAIGDHDRRANLTANISDAASTITSTVRAEDVVSGSNDLDGLRTEMKEISDQVDRILGQPPTATLTTTSPAGTSATTSSGHE
ncbi:MAG: hypothetical protein U0X20_20115 [Caldilineaceae bacterium]